VYCRSVASLYIYRHNDAICKKNVLFKVGLRSRRNKGIEVHPFFGKHADKFLTVVAGACPSTAHVPCDFGIGSPEALIAHFLTGLKVGCNFGGAGGNVLDFEDGVSPEAIALDIFFVWSSFQQGGKSVFFCKFFGGIYLHFGTDFYAIVTFGVVPFVGGEFPTDLLGDIRQEWHAKILVEVHDRPAKKEVCVRGQFLPAIPRRIPDHVEIGVYAIGFSDHIAHDGVPYNFPKKSQGTRTNAPILCILGNLYEAIDVHLGGLRAVVLRHEQLLLIVKMAILRRNR
jgi:hypothetical protein